MHAYTSPQVEQSKIISSFSDQHFLHLKDTIQSLKELLEFIQSIHIDYVHNAF